MKKDLNLEIGERVRTTRISRGFSRDELAELLGISTLFLSYIECGQRGMSLLTLQNMCKILKVSADYLLLGKETSAACTDEITQAIEGLDERYYPLALESINQLKKMISLIENGRKKTIQ
ncbi:MAG: helix-turn-helix transcriptional regulator [Clostridia bacterium]|nr:helix-turn-helix transcriptional regulator [Clostridia bacterium]